ncbi:hypothetical protein Pmar_PMAR005829 [Perkinsus marinus ATCC 50983]|uniref:Uncharacterized protein n=1 Tax=Perkinsus marinus (strain ATCC 50983 / TXsc) TaxID=423536 RepID=C5KYB7_PERM5|nr:hypothetical protein Pmar_PMAR005829 [Perkinsus marinus ATCC 50983]EER10494.1 hypothetical protein Pmar_PMAR005829 [Perkinsus marinus ATCC 50983]|eukprot:XP_002778699.1 hypothetical protein Pmar_PMAR005829 [Perkinsus marinus ATCC 50983]
MSQSFASLELQLMLGSGRCSKQTGWPSGVGSARRVGDLQYIDDDIVAYSSGDIVILMNTDTGKQRAYTGHTSLVSALAYGPDVKLMASGQCRRGHSKISDIHVWDPHRFGSVEVITTPMLCLAFHDSPAISTLCWLPGTNGYLCSVGAGSQKQVMAVWKAGRCAPTRRASLGAARSYRGSQKPICTTTCAAAEVVGSLPLFEHEDAYQWAIFGHGSVELETRGGPEGLAVVYLKVLRKRVVALQENGWCTILGDQHQTKSRRVAPVGERLIGASLWRHSITLQTAENPYAAVLDTRCDLHKQDLSPQGHLLASAPSAPCTCVAAAGSILAVGCSDGGMLYIYHSLYPSKKPLTLTFTLPPTRLLSGASGIDHTLAVTCIDAVNTEGSRPSVRIAVGYSNGYLAIFDLNSDQLSADNIIVQYTRGLSQAAPLTACQLSPLGGHCAVGCQDGLGYLLTFKSAVPLNEEVNEADSLVAKKDALHGHMCPVDNIMFVVTTSEASSEQVPVESHHAIHEMVHGTPVASSVSGRRMVNPRTLAQQAEEAKTELPALCLLTCSSRDGQVLCYDTSTHSRIPQTLKVLEIARTMTLPCNRWRLPSKAVQVCTELNVLAGTRGSRPNSALGNTPYCGVGSAGPKQVRGSPDGRLLCLCDKAAGIVEVADAASGERLAHRKTDGSAAPNGIAWLDNGTIAAVALDGTISLWRVPGMPLASEKAAKAVTEITEAELREMLTSHPRSTIGEYSQCPEVEDKENQVPSPDNETPSEEASSQEEEELPSTQHYQWEGEIDPARIVSGCYNWESPQRSMERKEVLQAQRARRETVVGKVGENQSGPSSSPWKDEGFVAGTLSTRVNPSANATGISELLAGNNNADDRFRRHLAATVPASMKPARGSLVKVKTSVEPGAYVISISGPSYVGQRIGRVIADLGAQIIRIESPVDSNTVKVPIGFDLSARLRIDLHNFQDSGAMKIMVPRRRAGTVCGYGEKLLVDTTNLTTPYTA